MSHPFINYLILITELSSNKAHNTKFTVKQHKKTIKFSPDYSPSISRQILVSNTAVELQESFCEKMSGKTLLDTFGDESIHAFDRWVMRFKNYMLIAERGGRWTDQERVAKLGLSLTDTPADLFAKLTSAERANLDSALATLRNKIDSPQRRNQAKRTLITCKQREDESFAAFLKRISPLVEMTYPGMNEQQWREKICEKILERLQPNLTFLLQLVGLADTRDLDALKLRAEQIEAALLAQQKGPSAIDEMLNAIRGGNYSGNNTSSLANASNQQSNEQLDDSEAYINQSNERWSNSRSHYNNEISSEFRDRSSGIQQERMSERNWSNNSYCNVCNRYGQSENSASAIQLGNWQAQELDDIIMALTEMRASISDFQDSRPHE
jgi:hypothetical protein